MFKLSLHSSNANQLRIIVTPDKYNYQQSIDHLLTQLIKDHLKNTKTPSPTNGTKFKKSLTLIWALTVSLTQVSKVKTITCLYFFPTNVTVCRLFCGMRTLTRLPKNAFWRTEKKENTYENLQRKNST